jgi:hypothetical protein
MGMLLKKLLIPGFVHLSQGKKVIGIVWIIGAIYGYSLFIIPGLLIHFIYIYKYCWKEVKLLIKGNNKAERLAYQLEEIAQKQSENIKNIKAVGDKLNFEAALEFANNEKFEEAITNLGKIPVNSDLYTEAQTKITEYQNKIEDEKKKKQTQFGQLCILTYSKNSCWQLSIPPKIDN